MYTYTLKTAIAVNMTYDITTPKQTPIFYLIMLSSCTGCRGKETEHYACLL